MERLKRMLDNKVAQYNCKEFIKDDPVQFAHAFGERKDIEVSALLASVIAWGNRKMILRSGQKMLFDIMERKPYDFVMQGSWQQMDESRNIHRTFFVRDFIYLCKGLQHIYTHNSSLENLFTGKDVWTGIETLRSMLGEANGGAFTRHISTPVTVAGKQASACKRLHMMLRWLCRRDGIVDLGIWQDIDPSQLMIPLDVHVARIGRELGLIESRQNNRRTVEALTARLCELCPDDPVKYDFALFGIGVEGEKIEI